jgi:hypothetical protein
MESLSLSSLSASSDVSVIVGESSRAGFPLRPLGIRAKLARGAPSVEEEEDAFLKNPLDAAGAEMVLANGRESADTVRMNGLASAEKWSLPGDCDGWGGRREGAGEVEERSRGEDVRVEGRAAGNVTRFWRSAILVERLVRPCLLRTSARVFLDSKELRYALAHLKLSSGSALSIHFRNCPSIHSSLPSKTASELTELDRSCRVHIGAGKAVGKGSRY